MLFWILAALISGVVIVALIWPLRAAADGEADLAQEEAGGDINVYRDQLKEIERDLERGTIAPQDAESARAEISRRLIAAARHESEGVKSSAAPDRARYAALASAVAIPVVTLFAYLMLGAPGTPDLPRAARDKTPDGRPTVASLIAKVEERLRQNPKDGRGWDVIAPVYYRMQRYPQSRAAYERAIALLGENNRRLMGLARVLLVMNRGRVTPDAEALYKKVLVAAPGSPAAMFWLAVAKEQRGEYAAAQQDYKAILAKAPEKAQWRADVERRLMAVNKRLSGAPLRKAPASGQDSAQQTASATPKTAQDAKSPAASAAPGPTREQVASAQKMTREERAKMIRGMVEGLAARLDEDGSDPAGWQRLIRAYVILGERDKAEAAVKKALKALQATPDKRKQVETFARALGLNG